MFRLSIRRVLLPCPISSNLAVVVEAQPQAKRLISSELANWSLQDVRSVEIPPPHSATYTYGRNATRPVVRDRQLLAVVHGYGPKGWRDPEARQAYLLVHAAGAHLAVAPISELEQQGTPVPRMFGQSLAGHDHDHRQPRSRDLLDGRPIRGN